MYFFRWKIEIESTRIRQIYTTRPTHGDLPTTNQQHHFSMWCEKRETNEMKLKYIVGSKRLWILYRHRNKIYLLWIRAINYHVIFHSDNRR